MPAGRKKIESLLAQHGLQRLSALPKPEEKPASGAPEMETSDGAPTRSQSTEPLGSASADTRRKLAPLLDKLALSTASEHMLQREAQAERIAAGDYEVEKVIGGEVVESDDGGFFRLRRWYPLDHKQGELALGALLDVPLEGIAIGSRDRELVHFDPRACCFVDTETIGIAGGAGTVAFLIGIGYFDDDGFVLEQLFMRDYDDEEPMLAYLAEKLRRFATVAGYNSKSFDLPLLRTRFIQSRIPFRGDALAHLDLVHVARRVWKRRISDCSLANVEREVLGFHRSGDVASHLIPQLWFSYLQSRDARPLTRVFYHHEMDIVSLVALTAQVARCFSAEAAEHVAHSEDWLSMARVHLAQKRYFDAIEHAKRFLESEDGDQQTTHRRECLDLLGMAYKRTQQWEEMVETWELLLQEFPSMASAAIELAKHYEHRARDWDRAEQVCASALETLASDIRISDSQRVHTAALRSRIERIAKKRERALRKRSAFEAQTSIDD